MQINKWVHKEGTIGHLAAMRTLTFVGENSDGTIFSDLGLPELWRAYVAMCEELFAKYGEV